MSDETLPVLPAQPWYHSPVFKAALLAFVLQVSAIAAHFGGKFSVTPDLASEIVEAVCQGGALYATYRAMNKRVTAPQAPLTLTAKAAAQHPNTAVAAAQTVTINLEKSDV